MTRSAGIPARRSGAGRWGVVLTLVATAVLSACDGFFFEPASREGASVTVAFQAAEPATQPGLQEAFDRLDGARIVLRQGSDVLFDGTVPLTPVPGGLVAEIRLEAGFATGTAELEVELTDGGDPLFEGVTTFDLVPGLPVGATVPITVVDDPPVIEILAPLDGAVGIEGVPVLLRGLALDKPDGDISDQIVWLVNGSPLDLTGGTVETSLGAGEFQITARVSDSGGNTASTAVEVTILEGVAVTTSSLPNGRVDVSYEAALSATGGDGTYLWSLASGALPPGLALGTDGTLSGIPTAGGTFEFTVQVASGGGTASRTLELLIDEFSPPVVATEELGDAVFGLPYEVQLTATGGDGNYSWTLVDGFLPEGLALSSEGLVSGVPTGTPGTRSFTVQVESAGRTARAVLRLTVVRALSVDRVSPPNGEVNQPYTFGFTASGGDGNYVWSVVAGAPPPGLSLDSGGTLSGTPTTAGTFFFSVEVSSAGQTATREVRVSVIAAVSAAEIAWVLEGSPQGHVRLLKADTRESLGIIEVGGDPVDLAVSPDNDRVVVVNAGSGDAAIIDTRLRQVFATVPLGGRVPSAVAISPDGTQAYITSRTTDDVVVVDLFQTRIVSSIPVGDAPSDLVVSPDGNDLYVVNSGDASVSLVDLLSGVQVDTIVGTSGDGYRHITLDPANDFIAYVTADDYIWVIQVEDGFELERIFISEGRPVRSAVSSGGLLMVAVSGSTPGVAVLEDIEGWLTIAFFDTPEAPRDLLLAADETQLWVSGGTSAPYLNIYAAFGQIFGLISSDDLPGPPFRFALPPGY